MLSPTYTLSNGRLACEEYLKCAKGKQYIQCKFLASLGELT